MTALRKATNVVNAGLLRCLLLAATLMAAGCGDGKDGPSGAAAETTAATERPKPTNAALEVVEIASVAPVKMRFSPSRLELAPGTYKFVLDNREEVAHNIRIQQGTKCCFKPGATDVGGTQVTNDIEKVSGTAKLEPGRYVFLCAIPGHWQQGMRGTIVVR